ncbi:MAG TPA: hypothetical protein VIG68_06605, partial [Lysobacter sp.]
PWLLAGVALALACVAARRRARLVAGVAFAFWLVSGLLGLLMLYLWLGTAHEFAWANRNLLLASPLALLGLPGALRRLRGRASGPLMQRTMPLLAGLALLATLMSWLEPGAQDNARWIALLLPLHVGLWLALRRASASAPGA